MNTQEELLREANQYLSCLAPHQAERQGPQIMRKLVDALSVAPDNVEAHTISAAIGSITIGDAFYTSDGAEIEGWDVEWYSKIIDAMPEFAQPNAIYDLHISARSDVAMPDRTTAAANAELPPQPVPAYGEWLDADHLLPSASVTDDSPCSLNGKQIPPAINSDLVLVALSDGRVRTDKITGLEGKPVWWETYGTMVKYWQPLPAGPQPGEKA